jgi:hypothetical protein
VFEKCPTKMKNDRRERLKAKLTQINKSKFLETPSMISYTDSERVKYDKKLYIAEHTRFHMEEFFKFAENAKYEDISKDAHPIIKQVREARREMLANLEKSREVVKYFIDLSGVKTSIMNKALKDIVLHENIKVTIADTNGKIKLNLTLNNINIYKIVNKTRTLLNNQEAMVFKCDMFN